MAKRAGAVTVLLVGRCLVLSSLLHCRQFIRASRIGHVPYARDANDYQQFQNQIIKMACVKLWYVHVIRAIITITINDHYYN